MYEVSEGKCVGVWGRCGETHGGVREGMGRCEGVKKCGERCGRVYGASVGDVRREV